MSLNARSFEIIAVRSLLFVAFLQKKKKTEEKYADALTTKLSYTVLLSKYPNKFVDKSKLCIRNVILFVPFLVL